MDILNCMGVVLKSLNHSEQSLVSMKSLPGKNYICMNIELLHGIQ